MLALVDDNVPQKREHCTLLANTLQWKPPRQDANQEDEP